MHDYSKVSLLGFKIGDNILETMKKFYDTLEQEKMGISKSLWCRFNDNLITIHIEDSEGYLACSTQFAEVPEKVIFFSIGLAETFGNLQTIFSSSVSNGHFIPPFSTSFGL